jgi:hypothetical protein
VDAHALAIMGVSLKKSVDDFGFGAAEGGTWGHGIHTFGIHVTRGHLS